MEAKETGDDNEDDKRAKAAKPLSAKVEAALAQARAAAKADHDRKSGRWLAVFPVGIGALLLALLMPRATRPDGVPLPRVDHRATSAIIAADNALAAEAEAVRLPSDVLAVGSAIRDLSSAEANDDPVATASARVKLERFVTEALERKDSVPQLLKLRALQTRLFVNAVAAWERSEEPKDFMELGGAFVKRAELVGWATNRHVVLDETQLRVAYKTMWNVLTHLDRAPFSVTLDEERAIYAFYIQHPRPPESSRTSDQNALRAAATPEECARARTAATRHEESWRAEKIRKLGTIDPTYPTDYALGVVHFRAGRGDLAVEAFNSYLQAHPDGAYAIRARNHLKAALTNVEP